MRKKISCKVIRTIPLGKSTDELLSSSRSSDKYYNNAAGISTTNPQVKDFSKSVIYTGKLDIKSIPIDNGPKTPILNFYA